MKRSILLIMILTFIFCVGQSFAGDKIALKISTLGPDGSLITKAFRNASAKIQEKTEGRIKLKIYPGGTMGNDSVVLRKFRNQLDGATFTAGGMSIVYKDFQVLSLPFLFENYKQVDATRKHFDPILTKKLEDKGYISFGIVEGGFAYMMSNKSIQNIDDLKKCKIWIPEGDPIGRTVFEEAGVPPIPVPLTDVLTNLSSGLIDTISSPPYGAVVLQWFTKVKYLIEQPLIYTYGTFVLTRRAWEKVPEADRPIVREAISKQLRQVDAQNRKDNREAMETLKKQGIKFLQLSEESMNQMKTVAKKSNEKMVQKGLFDQAMVEQVQKIIENIQE